MKQEYKTVSGEAISLKDLTAEEKVFLGTIFQQYEMRPNYLAFKHLYTEPEGRVFKSAKRLKQPVRECPLYRVCDDLAVRLGTNQGYLVKEEIMQYQIAPVAERKETTTGQVAKLAGCSVQAVRKAIISGRLRARKVGRLALIWDEDARAFADVVKGRRASRRRKHAKEFASA
jgi:excisionase family DNA binding protein